MPPPVTQKPYAEVPEDEWSAAGQRWVPISKLIATQEWVSLRVLDELDPRTDPIRVVQVGMDLYVENGHHRIIRARMRGKLFITAKVVSRHGR
jgi:hypothetical protein